MVMHGSSKAGCILPWKRSVVAAADEFEKEGTREHGERGRRHFKREKAPERERSSRQAGV
jgi:hypothetical protein